MKLEPVTKPGETNAATTKILNDGLILTDCNVIIIFLVYGQFGANQKPHSRPLFCKTYTLLIVTCYLTVNLKQN